MLSIRIIYIFRSFILMNLLCHVFEVDVFKFSTAICKFSRLLLTKIGENGQSEIF